jgi:hypothetical protein
MCCETAFEQTTKGHKISVLRIYAYHSRHSRVQRASFKGSRHDEAYHYAIKL